MDRAIAKAIDDARREFPDDELGPIFDLNRPRLASLAEHVQRIGNGRSLRVLDVGCYPFFLGEVLERLGHEMFGVCSPHQPVDRDRIAQVDIEQEPFPWSSAMFDVVVFTEVIEHLPQTPVPVLREMRRVTTPGGSLVVTAPNIARARNRWVLLAGGNVMYSIDQYFENDGAGTVIFDRHNREYTLGELRTILERTGWTIESARCMQQYPYWFREPEKSFLSRHVVGRIKQAMHYVVPRGKDSLLVIAKA